MDQLQKTHDTWTLPPELAGPTPRPVAPGPLPFRLLRMLPKFIFLFAIAVMVFSFWNPALRGAQAQNMGQLITDQLAALQSFLNAPRWQSWMLWPVVILAAMLVFTTVPAFFRYRREKRLLQTGVPARAVIRSFARGRGGVWWHLEYPDQNGDTIKTSLLKHNDPEPGHSVLTVLYNPGRPHDLVIYPVRGFRVG